MGCSAMCAALPTSVAAFGVSHRGIHGSLNVFRIIHTFLRSLKPTKSYTQRLRERQSQKKSEQIIFGDLSRAGSQLYIFFVVTLTLSASEDDKDISNCHVPGPEPRTFTNRGDGVQLLHHSANPLTDGIHRENGEIVMAVAHVYINNMVGRLKSTLLSIFTAV